MISYPTIPILGVDISRFGLSKALEQCRSQIEARKGGYVCFVNVHSLTEGSSTQSLRDCLNGAAFAFADGVPLVWVSRWKGTAIESRVCGPDFMQEFLRKNQDIAHGFIGGQPGQGEVIATKAGISGISYSPPMRSFSPDHAKDDWERFLKLCPGGRAPSVVWVGLGAPKQEYWMQEVSRLAPHSLFFGVGAAFDFLAGTKTRAPVWMQRAGLEWLFRFAQEPRRLWRRYLSTHSRFILALVKHRELSK